MPHQNLHQSERENSMTLIQPLHQHQPDGLHSLNAEPRPLQLDCPTLPNDILEHVAPSADNCPLPSKVYGCSPKCVQNYDCKNGKVCCSNSCNSKSCSEPAPYGGSGSSGSSGSKYQTGSGIYCDNVKCNAFEVCKQDPATKRNKCSKA